MKLVIMGSDRVTGALSLVSPTPWASREEALAELSRIIAADDVAPSVDLLLVDLDTALPVVLFERPAEAVAPVAEPPVFEEALVPEETEAVVEPASVSEPPVPAAPQVELPVEPAAFDADAVSFEAPSVSFEAPEDLQPEAVSFVPEEPPAVELPPLDIVFDEPAEEPIAEIATVEEPVVEIATVEEPVVEEPPAVAEAAEPAAEEPAPEPPVADAAPEPLDAVESWAEVVPLETTWAEESPADAAAVPADVTPLIVEEPPAVTVAGLPAEDRGDLAAALAAALPDREEPAVPAGEPEEFVFGSAAAAEPLIIPAAELGDAPVDEPDILREEHEAATAAPEPAAQWPWDVPESELDEPEPIDDDAPEAEVAVAESVAEPLGAVEPLGATETAPVDKPVYEPSATSLTEYTCDDCVYVNTCPNQHQKAPTECGSFQWKSM
jgi:nicotinate-nucleotide--dimethylbenzimidazole phosphoribosyltransferase